MTRPVRPVALVILTVAMVYPGVTLLFQGGYPFINGDYFNLVGSYGPWASFFGRFGVPQQAVDGFKVLLGLMWALLQGIQYRQPEKADPSWFGTVQSIAVGLFTTFLYPFELTSILLLVAAIGAIYLSRKNIDDL